MPMNRKCRGLIESNNYYNNSIDIAPLRVAVLNRCRLTLVDYFNIIIKAIKRPFDLTYCESYNGPGINIVDELVNNRSDFSPNIAGVNYDYYQTIQYSSKFFFGNVITILSGKILANNGIGLSLLDIFSLEIWIIFIIMLIFISISNGIMHKENSKCKFLDHFTKLWTMFINQSITYGNICCVKHLILNSVTVISIFIMTLLFTSQILSNLCFHPLVMIDTLDDLVEYVTQHDDLKLISNDISSSWLIMKKWEDEKGKFLFNRMTSVPDFNNLYKQVYHGKYFIISYDTTFEHIVANNPGLYFHMSADRLFSKSHGMLYSKNIDIKIKRLIDSIMSSMLESGIYKHNHDKQFSRHLNIEEDDPSQTISLSYFKKIVILYSYKVILLLFILIIEFLVFNCRKIIFPCILYWFFYRDTKYHYRQFFFILSQESFNRLSLKYTSI